SMYSDIKSDSNSSIVDNVLVSSSDKSFFGSAATTSKAKRVKNDLVCGSPLGSLDYDMDDNDSGFLPPPFGISLEKKWLDPKIVKTQVEVAVKKFFALDINFLAVKGKLATAKTQVIRKLFSKINGFGEATTPSKFEGIIKSIFTSEINMEKAVLLAREEGITINTDLKKQGICSDQAVIIKEILMNTPKRIIIAALFEFADLLAAKWSFLIGKNSVCVAKAVRDCETWASRNQFRALLFTLLVDTTVHDLGNFLEKAGRKTCVINWSLESGNRIHCAVVGFESDEMLESAFCMVPILGKVKLSWTRLGFVQCNRYGKLGYLVLECDAEIAFTPKPPKSFIKWLYTKKSVPISCPAAFGSKLWAQVISFVSMFFGLSVGSNLSFSSSNSLGSGGLPPSIFLLNSALNECLSSLEQSLGLLSDQVSCILKCLNGARLVFLVPVSNEISAMSVS
ncbi:hypothetical protein G9A89_021141, partial [Geosiphon pyriformis]